MDRGKVYYATEIIDVFMDVLPFFPVKLGHLLPL